jgi:hypothetical protein
MLTNKQINKKSGHLHRKRLAGRRLTVRKDRAIARTQHCVEQRTRAIKNIGLKNESGGNSEGFLKSAERRVGWGGWGTCLFWMRRGYGLRNKKSALCSPLVSNPTIETHTRRRLRRRFETRTCVRVAPYTASSSNTRAPMATVDASSLSSSAIEVAE